MKLKVFLLTLILFSFTYADSRASDTMAQETSTYIQPYTQYRYESVREWNELLTDDIDSLMSYTVGIGNDSIVKGLVQTDTLRSVDWIDLDAATRANPNYSSYYNILVTSVSTIGHVGETTTDYAFATAANTTEQSVSVDTVPAYARIIDVCIITTEAVAGITTSFSVDIGDAAGDAEFAAATDIKGANALIGGDASEAILLMPIATETAIFVNGTPDAENWSAMSGGEFTVITTYLDYGAIK